MKNLISLFEGFPEWEVTFKGSQFIDKKEIPTTPIKVKAKFTDSAANAALKKLGIPKDKWNGIEHESIKKVSESCD
jgi:hypothetical protein